MKDRFSSLEQDIHLPDRFPMNLSDTAIFPLGFGTAKLRSVNGGLSARSSKRLLEVAFEEGIRFFDTAPSYGQSQAEEAIGGLSPRIRNEISVCSKVGYRYGRNATVIRALKPFLRPTVSLAPFLKKVTRDSRGRIDQQSSIRVDIQPAAIRVSLVATLRRLRRDTLDVLLLHDASMESLSAANSAELDSLAKEGLIRQWGVSTSDLAVAHRAVEVNGLAVLQVPVYSAWVGAAGDLFAKCRERGVDVIANRVLSALYRETKEPISVKVESVWSVNQCFEFALRQPAVRIVLCGTTDSGHLRANVKVMRTLLYKQLKESDG
jgi:aryl-alcohol dehydrogenase-like predicted oxidoreductase